MPSSVPPVLVRSRRCSRTPPRQPGSTSAWIINTNEKEDKEKIDDRSRVVHTGSGLARL